MRTSTFRAVSLRESNGMDVGVLDTGPAARLGVGAAWARVEPGGRSMANQHDEIETWVIISGCGEVVVDADRHPVSPGMVVQFDPFETHFVENTGEGDLVFASFYWRDIERAVSVASGLEHRRFGKRPVFVFSSAPTPNGDLHLGHLAGPFFAADVFVRFQRMIGNEAWHLTGSDDFQSYVAATARREGRTPAETAAHYSAEIFETLALMDIDVHQYTATSADGSYAPALRRFFSRLAASSAVEPRKDAALFDSADGRYLYEADVAGRCPTCDSDTSGNICEGCREPNSCVDLIAPHATDSRAPAREGTITRYMLALHDLAPEVAAHHGLGRVPAAVKELADRVFRRDRLDIALTHPAEWGVPPTADDVAGEERSADMKDQVIWAWVDYAFSILYGIEALGRRVERDWHASAPQADWKIVHFLGSDGTFYHPILLPALYRLAHPEWTPDVDYNINEFYQLSGSKFSTSRGHAVWGKDIVTADSVDAVRFYLALTRPEGRRTDFELAAYESFVRDTLIRTWQRWLNDLGSRVEERHGGVAPDSGIWTPEHTAFLARLETRLSALSGSLGQDGFSLNNAAEALNGIVDDAVAFTRRESPQAGIERWKDEARTGIALELAAARLLATCAAPVMPRFAGRLAAALGDAPPAEWPRTVPMVTPGTPVGLAGQAFFGEPVPHADGPAPLRLDYLEDLEDIVRDTLRLPSDAPVAGRTLVELGMESLHAITLQYRIAADTGADIGIEDMLGCRSLADLAALIAVRAQPRAEGQAW